jgi:glycine/D-amino acid oxidase-like deaminating enzyme
MLGSSLAVLLARHGARVTLFDAAERPMSRAGRWNEGKIHLGYIYAADRTLNTARKLIPGGQLFKPIVESIIESQIEGHLTCGEEFYLTHTDSVVDPATMLGYLNAVWELNGEMSKKATKPTRLTQSELGQISDNPKLVAGFRIPEQSVNTSWIADRITARLTADNAIEIKCDCIVKSAGKGARGWSVVTRDGNFNGFDVVVNALWEGKSAVDEATGYGSGERLSYRYRASIFMKVAHSGLGNVVITTGPFGDTKNYEDGSVYLSWYPAGLLLDCRQAHAPATPVIDGIHEIDIRSRTIDALSGFFPAVANLPVAASEMAVRGGWVVAHGGGLLSDLSSQLHRRDEFGVSRYGSYYSVDVGKYSVAPWLASQLANELT